MSIVHIVFNILFYSLSFYSHVSSDLSLSLSLSLKIKKEK